MPLTSCVMSGHLGHISWDLRCPFPPSVCGSVPSYKFLGESRAQPQSRPKLDQQKPCCSSPCAPQPPSFCSHPNPEPSVYCHWLSFCCSDLSWASRGNRVSSFENEQREAPAIQHSRHLPTPSPKDHRLGPGGRARSPCSKSQPYKSFASPRGLAASAVSVKSRAHGRLTIA